MEIGDLEDSSAGYSQGVCERMGQPVATRKGDIRETLQATLAPVLSALKTTLGERLVAVVLFGSRARGDARPESDWDVLVVAKGLPPKPFQRHLYLKRMLPPEWRGKISLLAKTPEEFEAHMSSLYLDLAMDGIVLYDTNGYMSSRLEKLRQALRRAGLHRVRRDGSWVWEWEHYPGVHWSLDWGAEQ